MINEHLATFHGLDVTDYTPGHGLGSPADHAWRIAADWSKYDKGPVFTDLWPRFLAEPGVNQVKALVIGPWAYEMYEATAQTVIDAIAASAAQLPALRAVFIGDIIGEENEISWIVQGDAGPLLRTLPGLRELGLRGGNGLRVSNASHAGLRRLIVQTGGLPKVVVNDILTGDFPALEHLELWLGNDNYGGDATPDDFALLLAGSCFPALVSLGLMNSEIIDALVPLVAKAPILERIEALDLSMGTMSDAGAEALLQSPKIRRLRHLNLRRNYLTGAMCERLLTLGIPVNIEDQEDPDDDYQSCEVSE